VGMSTETTNNDFDDRYLLDMVGRLPTVDREILPNIWMTVPDSRNRDGPEGRLDSSASVHCRLDISYTRTFT
jgi:hypothetical protein